MSERVASDEAIAAAVTQIICACHGYSDVEVEEATDESNEDAYDAGIASEVAEVTSIVRDLLASLSGQVTR